MRITAGQVSDHRGRVNGPKKFVMTFRSGEGVDTPAATHELRDPQADIAATND